MKPDTRDILRAFATLAVLSLLHPAPAGTLAASREEPGEARSPGGARLTPTRKVRVVSVWAGLAGADDSDATMAGGGLASPSSAEDFSSFLLLGARIECFPSSSARLAKHFGFGVDVTGMIGEVEFPITDGAPPDEAELTAAVVAPSLVIQVPGRRWEAYLGLGLTLLWGSRLSDVSTPTVEDDDTDGEIPLEPSVYLGFRRTSHAGWFFMMEGRYQRGENAFRLGGSGTRIHLDWSTVQMVFGSGYRF